MHHVRLCMCVPPAFTTVADYCCSYVWEKLRKHLLNHLCGLLFARQHGPWRAVIGVCVCALGTRLSDVPNWRSCCCVGLIRRGEAHSGARLRLYGEGLPGVGPCLPSDGVSVSVSSWADARCGGGYRHFVGVPRVGVTWMASSAASSASRRGAFAFVPRVVCRSVPRLRTGRSPPR